MDGQKNGMVEVMILFVGIRCSKAPCLVRKKRMPSKNITWKDLARRVGNYQPGGINHQRTCLFYLKDLNFNQKTGAKLSLSKKSHLAEIFGYWNRHDFRQSRNIRNCPKITSHFICHPNFWHLSKWNLTGYLWYLPVHGFCPSKKPFVYATRHHRSRSKWF